MDPTGPIIIFMAYLYILHLQIPLNLSDLSLAIVVLYQGSEDPQEPLVGSGRLTLL